MNQQLNEEKTLTRFHKRIKSITPTKKPNKKLRLLFNAIILIALGSIVVIFTIPMFGNYTIRMRLSEGLILASDIKNLVDDNIVNGFSPAEGWTGFQRTQNIQAIIINKESGVIYIVGDPQRTGGAVLALIPVDRNKRPLVAHEIPQSAIHWVCRTVTLGNTPPNQIRPECRTKMSEIH